MAIKYYPKHSEACCTLLGSVVYLQNDWAIFKCTQEPNELFYTHESLYDFSTLETVKEFSRNPDNAGGEGIRFFKRVLALFKKYKPKLPTAINVKHVWKQQFARKIKVIDETQLTKRNRALSYAGSREAVKRSTTKRRSTKMSDTSVSSTGQQVASDTSNNSTGTDSGTPELTLVAGTTSVPATAVTRTRKPKAKSFIRLASGEVTVRGPGRAPLGSVAVDADGNPMGEVVVGKAKKVTMIKLPDGTVKPRSRGRQPKGAVIFDG
jgi:hypothetical protein